MAKLPMSRMGMGDATIPLHGIRAATFKAMLRFMYTDAACPEEEETDLGDSQYVRESGASGPARCC